MQGDLAQMVERSLSMREALGSIPRFSKNFLFLKHRFIIVVIILTTTMIVIFLIVITSVVV